MKYPEIVNPGIIVIEVLLAIIAIIMIAAFAYMPYDGNMLLAALLTMLILTQLFAINILINIYNKLGGKKR